MKVKILPILMTFILIVVTIGIGYFVLNLLPKVTKEDTPSAFSQYQNDNDTQSVSQVKLSTSIADIKESVIDPLLDDCKLEPKDEDMEKFGAYASEVNKRLIDHVGVLNDDGSLRMDKAFEARTITIGKNFCSFVLVEEAGGIKYLIFQRPDGDFEKVDL